MPVSYLAPWLGHGKTFGFSMTKMSSIVVLRAAIAEYIVMAHRERNHLPDQSPAANPN
jgi:hypothetical protein